MQRLEMDGSSMPSKPQRRNDVPSMLRMQDGEVTGPSRPTVIVYVSEADSPFMSNMYCHDALPSALHMQAVDLNVSLNLLVFSQKID